MVNRSPGGARGDQAGLVGEDDELRTVAGAICVLMLVVAVTVVRVRRADL
jgi:hypothetical protein